MDVVNNRTDEVSAIVEYDYTAKESDELDLVRGAIIHSIKLMPGGWWEGTLETNGKTGMFPDNFVRLIDINDENTVQLREKSATNNRRCKVIYSYTQVNDDELSLAVGDVIEFLGEVEEGWWRGRLKNKVGVFPSNFVITIEHSPKQASKRPPSSIKTTTSNHSNSSNSTNSSSHIVKKNNRLSLHSSKEDLLSNTSGISTSNSTLAISSTSIGMSSTIEEQAPTLPPKPQREYCRVEYPYAPQNDDELELKVGDVITIISTDLPDKGWWKGELRGKVGVFPDNFVKVVPPVSPANDTQEQHSHRAANKTTSTTVTSSGIASNGAAATTTTTQITSSVSNNVSSTSATTTKVYVKKSGSSSSTHSSQRKDSFGSRDSLNDILSETGLPSGNVAAQRKSLENKNLDLSKKQPQLPEAVVKNVSGITNELRKSLENMDEKTKKPPPVLSTKPSVPNKKGPTVTSVAGNILSGLKQRVKSVENKLTTAASQDSADGLVNSRMSNTPSNLPDAGAGGSVLMRRAATIAGEEADFDHVERASMLPDMRAGRVRAPKRRPPSAAINIIGESNNNVPIYINGSGNGEQQQLLSEQENNNKSSDDNSMGEDAQLAKPKPREWEKKKAPWMEELKASQVRKKTSPNVDRNSKLLEGEVTTTQAKIHSSSSTTSTVMQQSLIIESSSSSSQTQLRKEEITSMSKSLIGNTANTATTTTTNSALATGVDDVRARPNSLSIRNRSISPSLRISGSSITSNTALSANSSDGLSNSLQSNAAKPTPVILHNHNHQQEVIPEVPANNINNARVSELERRVDKLETLVQSQQSTIDELVRALREETDRVKVLRGELEKYAQCVTQV